MGILANLGFSAPWILLGLAVLPLLYFLLRLTPPSPKREIFPPLRLLLGLASREEMPARSPLWILLLRLFAAALVIAALAGPIWGARPQDMRNGPLVLVVDNGWTAAQNWKSRHAALTDLVREARQAGRAVALIATAEAAQEFSLLPAGQLMRLANGLQPQAWLPQREAALAPLLAHRFDQRPEIVWLSDGLDHGDKNDQSDVIRALAQKGDMRILADAPLAGPFVLLPPVQDARGFKVQVQRGFAAPARESVVDALGERGEILGSLTLQLEAGRKEAKGLLPLPLELRNRTTKLSLRGVESAGAVQLLDGSHKRKSVGLVSAGSTDHQQPLLSDIFYLERALTPFADLRKGTLDRVLSQGISVLILADIGRLVGADRDRVQHFVEGGGVLLRFAGARMADGTDDLIPVRLRGGGRFLDGALAFAAPQALGDFPESGVFAGLQRNSDVSISRQILAEPSVELAGRIWARLADGTPLVTAAQRGKGWIVLFHVTASPAWSSLPLSGLYVDMLRRVLDLGGGTRTEAIAPMTSLAPLQVLNGFGHWRKAPAELTPLRGHMLADVTPSQAHPPGLYGDRQTSWALNAAGQTFRFEPLGASGQRLDYYSDMPARDLAPPLLALAFVLMLVDFLLSLQMRGILSFGRRAAGGMALLLAALHMGEARADDAFAMRAALDTRLAFVRTGLSDVDAMSRAGLMGLNVALTQRTSYEPLEPMAVDLERDDLSFFPLLYWPMDGRLGLPSPKVISKLSAYMKNGGTILFDTRDLTLGAVRGEQSPGVQALRRISEKLDLPQLEPIPADHVLTKAFYLLQQFPGRWDGGKVWVEKIPPPDPDAGPSPARGGDGVSPVIIGGNDWAAAWAMDQQGRPIVAVMPGGEAQREMAYRFGVNVVMYAFTGNYKTDQVHVPALLERLGQ